MIADLAITPRDWKPDPKCCWCQSRFVEEEILGKFAMVCPTPACRERQVRWQMLDVDGKLFYLPTPKQVELEEAVESQRFRFICIGGDRGGAKSTGLRYIAYRYCRKFQGFNALLLRRTYQELLRNHVRKAQREQKLVGSKVANFLQTFDETGSALEYGHCQDLKDFTIYVGSEYDMVLIEQIEEFIDQQVTEISASTGRIRRVGWRGVVLAGENPGGPLSAFVDELFISKSRDRVKYPNYNPDLYHFIPAQLEDNPYVDDDYTDFLAGLEPIKRDMYRFGRRDVFPNQYFKAFKHPQRIQRLVIQTGAIRICALHWAYQKQGIFLWAVILPDGRLYVEREYPFSETRAVDVARAITGLSKAAKMAIVVAWANPPKEIPESEHGEDIFETLFLNGLPVIRSDHDPVAGWQRLQHWLQPMGQTADPALIVSPDCAMTIRTLPQLIQSQSNAEEVDESGAIAAARALRYLVMSRPAVPQAPEKPSGRDLSQMDERTRADIERLARIEVEEAKPPVSYFPFSSE